MRYHTPVKIAKSYMNRFTIDEDASFELIGVHDVPLISGKVLFSIKLTEIRRKLSIKNIRESETHFIFALSDDASLFETKNE